MTFHVFLFLLVFVLLLFLARLGRLDWLHLQPSHSPAGSRRTLVHRLLRPRTPLDCPISPLLLRGETYPCGSHAPGVR
jgi:hypothetical protein